MIDDNKKSELFQCFKRGWRDGCCGKMQDNKFTNHTRTDIVSAYLDGYIKGKDASTLALAEECRRLGYDPRMSILRR